MKYRLDFVTNSSSSCYVCDVCGTDASGMDLCLSDAGMCSCTAGHTFCESHMHIGVYDDDNVDLKEILIALIQEKIQEYETGYKWLSADEKVEYVKEHKERLQEVINDTLSVDEMRDLTDDEYEFRYKIPAIYCPICNFENVDSNDVLKYMLILLNTTEEETLKLIKEKFGTYQKFTAFINGSK